MSLLDPLRGKLLLRTRYLRFRRYLPCLDAADALRLAFWRNKSSIRVRPKGIEVSVVIRAGSSDIDVFEQIFLQAEYACLADLGTVESVIDAGANVGYSSVYFLSRFPSCRVVAVEPDPENFAALSDNLSPFRDRVALHQAGVWTQTVPLVIESTPYRDGRDWTRQVRQARADEDPDIQAITIADLLRELGCERLSLLKMDIEGAEAVVFADPACQEWLPMVDAIAIELHEDSSFGPAHELFHAAIRNENFLLSSSGELTICRRAVPVGAGG